MKTKVLLTLIILSALSIFASNSYSQEKNNSHFFEMNFITLSYDQADEFLNFYETYGKDIDAQNEYIISTKILRHVSGPSWTLCFITEYKDMESFAASQKRQYELFEKAYPDKTKIEEVFKKWGSFLKGHTDALVSDNPSLEKGK